ncbi:hypothetical protein OIU35_13865 [Boseaceae bacterium BT-24-1]|nr:hypothetical protein [Boseaceae bacterium BT-24-1]
MVARWGRLAGGTAGALVDAGVPEADANRQAQDLTDGSSLVAVQVEPQETSSVEPTMDAGLPIAGAEPKSGTPADERGAKVL